ncbi:type II toxin-antitoxin system HipA family toxin [Novosphingobium sp.]|uniref:type II toxin-antitoxin system HipA family toxin n=1 Tax=Novosphingobium sp. TaxID=1874826 RepID=UPI0025EE6E3A|nr:type II toxin-antitoxin system HipA family toxin [Novosphingobium sp.]
MSDRELLVFVDLAGVAHFVGRLWARRTRNRESATFEYDAGWLASPARFALEPALMLGGGPLHTQQGRALFGAFGDSAPDRWGRNLIQRAERRRAATEARAPRSLGEVDYLLGVGDIARQGALRFKETPDGPFLASGEGVNVPPLIRLGELLNAAMRVAADGDDENDLRLILAPGSSLGGARAKASVLDLQGQLSIAKFPQADDPYPVMQWEAVSLDLANRAGIEVPTWRLEQVVDRTALLLRRFDRDGEARVPFLSAMSMLGAADNEDHSYLEIVDALRQFGSQPERDCAQLWRRIVFNILISNTDDHLRNHGFLFDGAGGWRLSPAYDMNPTPLDVKARVLSLAIDEADDTASLDVAFGMARQCGLKLAVAKEIVAEVQSAVSQWRNCAATHGLNARDVTRMASAFEL